MKASLFGLCLFTLIMKILKHTPKCVEQKDPGPSEYLSLCFPNCFIGPPPPSAPRSACIFVFLGGGSSGIYFKVNPKHHIIPCSPNTLVYTSKKEEKEEEEEEKTEREEG